MHDLLDIFIIHSNAKEANFDFLQNLFSTLCGFATAMITYYYTARIKEKRENIEKGKQQLWSAYLKKMTQDEYKKSGTDFYCANLDFQKFIKKHEHTNHEIIENLSRNYSTLDEAKSTLKFIKELVTH
jgi:hypothetical protein